MPKFSAYMRGEKGIQGETGQASLLDGIVNGYDNLPDRAGLAEDRNYVYYVKENDGIHLYVYKGGSGDNWQHLGVATAGFSTTQYASASTKEWFPGVQPDVTITPHEAQQTTGLKSFDFHFNIPESQPAGFSTNQPTSVSTLNWNENATVEITPDENSPDWDKSFLFKFGIPHGREAGFSTTQRVSVSTLSWTSNATVSVSTTEDSDENPFYNKVFDFAFGIPQGEPAGFGTLSTEIEILNHLSTATFNITEGGTNREKDLKFNLGIPAAHPAGFSTITANAYDLEWNENPEASITTNGNDWEKNFDFSFGIPHGRPAGFANEMEVSVTTLSSTSNATVSITPDETTPDYAKKFNFDFGIPKGVPGGFGNISVSTQQVGSAIPAEVTITTSGPESAKNFEFLFKIPQGKGSGDAVAGIYIPRSFLSTNIDSTSTIYWSNNILYVKNSGNRTIPIYIINNQNQNVASTFKIDKQNENILYYSDSPFDGTIYLIDEAPIPEFFVHSVSTVSPSTTASVNISYLEEDNSQVFLDFYLPKGDKGDTALSIDKINVFSLEDKDDEPYAEVTTDVNQKIEMTFYLPRGLDGADGAPGPKGDSALTIDSVNVYSLSNDAEPYATTHISENSAIIDFYLPKGKKGDQGDTGNGINSIINLGTVGLTTTYQINYTDSNPTTFEIINGSKGDTGNGISSITNLGTNGLTTTYQINYTSTNITPTTFEVINGEKGDTGNGISSITNLGTIGLTTTYQINYTDNNTTTFEVINGEQGPKGDPGNSIKSILKTNTNESTREDTYTITFTDDSTTTYIIKNGEKGEKGDTALTISNISITTLAEGETNPHADVTTDINHDVSIKFYLPRGATGTGISSITKGQSEGLIDNYIINYDNGTTTGYQVTNGKGIQSITKGLSEGLIDNYKVEYGDGLSTTFQITNGNGIQSINLTNVNGLEKTYTITYTNNSTTTFIVKDGLTGDKGDPGQGIQSIIKESTSGVIDNYKINYGDGLSTTFQVTNGTNIRSINLTNSNGLIDTYTITLTDNSTTTYTITNGAQGPQGPQGNKGDKGDPGLGIQSITKDSTSGLIDNYKIEYGDGLSTTFQITNGTKGDPGNTGNGISSVQYIDSEGLQDNYRINFTNNTYFDFAITNGAVVGDIRSIIYTTTDPGVNTSLTTGDIILVYDEE